MKLMKQIIIEMSKMRLGPQEKGQKTAQGRYSIYERKMQLYFFLKSNHRISCILGHLSQDRRAVGD